MGIPENDERNAKLAEADRARILHERKSRLLGELTKVAETARNFGDALDDLDTKAKITDQAARQLELARSFSRVLAQLLQWRLETDSRFAALDELTGEDAELDRDWGNAIVRIRHAWDAAVLSIQGSTETDGDKILAVTKQAEASVDKVILEAGFVTIPPRAASNLGKLDIGEALDFYGDFADEVKRPEDLKAILAHIKSHPLLVDGLVDLENGKIIRVSRDPKRVAQSGARVAGSFVLGLAVVVGLALPVPGNPNFGADLFYGYLFIFLGALAHVGVDVLKDRNSPQAIDVPDRWGLWLEVKERSMLQAVLTLFVGYIGLVWLSRSGLQSETHRVDALTAFFTGYSIDSIVDAWLKRFELVVSTKTNQLNTSFASQPA